MAATITAAEVKSGFSTSVPDSEINLWITLVDQADTCLDANSVAPNIQKALKLTAVRHLLWGQSNQGKGTVTSESAPSGASRSYGRWSGDGSPYWEMLKMSDMTGCVRKIIDNKRQLQFMSIGGSHKTSGPTVYTDSGDPLAE